MEFVNFKCAFTIVAAAGLVYSDTLEAQENEQSYVHPAVGTEVFFSTDRDQTEVIRVAADFDLRNIDENDRLGVRFEKAWYRPVGQDTQDRERIFVLYGNEAGGWQLRARVGTDMHTAIGAISANDTSAYRKEVFVERDIVETPMGLDETPIYSTFGGAAIDLPLNDRNIINLLAGYQIFTGKNERIHLRGTYVHVVKPELGLSAQLRARYFHSSVPAEFDYYSPGYYAQVLPIVQMRRFTKEGWMLQAAGGIGLQRDSNRSWNQSTFAQLRIESPVRSSGFSLNGELTYTDTPSDNSEISPAYNYFQAKIGIVRRF
ncbi:hypothetical protein GRI44_02440 [Altererythrobacter confluentis]|uniref:Uncharacterized protein n=1 Tax=Allopontixanthobacter confluentis TaxID=1849021 RepID=A0A6L7GC35_9SPHN|nr:hypothetical protein [Allopontixanthobacter confluentis]MXP13612.1 hypothetical protein [Allopontixanthobacter confluentis]